MRARARRDGRSTARRPPSPARPGFTADLSAAFAGIDGLLLAVALAAVFLILIVVYRSPLLPFIVLFTSLTALCASVFTVVAARARRHPRCSTGRPRASCSSS